MLAAPLTRAEEREAGAPEREADADANMQQPIPVDKEQEEKEAAQQRSLQQPSVPVAAPGSQRTHDDTAFVLPAEGGAPSEQRAAGAGEVELAVKDRSAAAPEQAHASGCSNHRVRQHLAGNSAAIALVITSGSSTEAKVAQRVVNRSGQKALQGFFSEVFETVTAS